MSEDPKLSFTSHMASSTRSVLLQIIPSLHRSSANLELHEKYA